MTLPDKSKNGFLRNKLICLLSRKVLLKIGAQKEIIKTVYGNQEGAKHDMDALKSKNRFFIYFPTTYSSGFIKVLKALPWDAQKAIP